MQTPLHFICLTDNFLKVVVKLNWVAKWDAARKRLKTTDLEHLKSGSCWKTNKIQV